MVSIAAPIALIGVINLVFGLYKMAHERNGKLTFSTPGWFVPTGVTSSLSYVEPNEEIAGKFPQEEKVPKEKEEYVVASDSQFEKEGEEAAKAEKEKIIVEEKAEQQQLELVSTFGLELVTISYVVDGDTVKLIDGRKVRLVGINTPESTTRTEEYGKESSNYTSSQLTGKQVYIQKDGSDTDRYGRYLRVIWLSIPRDDMDENEIRSKMFNAILVLKGYAEPSSYLPDVKYSNYFVNFAREARENNAGLWAFGENGTTKGDFVP